MFPHLPDFGTNNISENFLLIAILQGLQTEAIVSKKNLFKLQYSGRKELLLFIEFSVHREVSVRCSSSLYKMQIWMVLLYYLYIVMRGVSSSIIFSTVSLS